MPQGWVHAHSCQTAKSAYTHVPEELLPGSWRACHPRLPPRTSRFCCSSQGKGRWLLLALHSCQELGLPTVPSAAASPATPNSPPAGLFWKAWLFFACLSPSQWCGRTWEARGVAVIRPALDSAHFCRFFFFFLPVCNLITYQDTGRECLSL